MACQMGPLSRFSSPTNETGVRQTFTISYSHSQIAVLDPKMQDPFNRWEPVHVAQGFAWRPTCVCFAGLFGGGDTRVEFQLADRLSVGTDSARAIRVPFTVTSSGQVEIGFVTNQVVTVPPGEYDLLFEVGGMNEDDQWCRITFAPASSQPAAILRKDPALHPPAQLTMTAQAA